MGETIQIHVGQAGVQIANACWELYCLEHGINACGALCTCPCDHTFKNFFSINDTNKVVPRAVLVDSEPTVVDQVRTGPYGRLYNPGSLISGKEDSGSNFARGYYTMGAELIDITMDAIRLAAESCCNLKGFLLFRSIGGGTGSGLGNLIAEQLQDEYGKTCKFEFIIFPSPSMSPLIVEPYNALLSTHLGMDVVDCTFILDNEALYEICAAKLNICAPKYKNLNRIIAQTASTFTTSQRYAGSSNISFTEIQTNLVAFPRVHYPVVSYAPFITGTGQGYTHLSTEQITNACFTCPSSQLTRVNPVEGRYMACVLLYRGKIASSDINYATQQIKANNLIQFVDWSPTGFKIGMSDVTPYTVPGGGLGISNKALLALSNNTIIQKVWCRLLSKYNLLYSRRAFVHHYTSEGLEDDAFKEAADDIDALISDYKEVDMSGDSYEKQHDSIEGGPRFRTRSEFERCVEENCGDKASPDDLPQLQGLQSLNYIFGDTNYIGEQEATKISHKVSECPSRRPSLRNIDHDTNTSFNIMARRSREGAHEKKKSGKSIQKRFNSSEGTLAQKPKNLQNFDQGMDSEACRAYNRFSNPPACHSDRCCPGNVLVLPPINPEGKETMCEALAAKERFCNSKCKKSSLNCCWEAHLDDQRCVNPCDIPTCAPPCAPTCGNEQNPLCYYPVAVEDPCTNQTYWYYECDEREPQYCLDPQPQFCLGTEPSCNFKYPPTPWCYPPEVITNCAIPPVRPPICNIHGMPTPCFCNQRNRDVNYANSDDKLITTNCRPQRCERPHPPDCFCERHIDGVFDLSSTVLMSPRWRPSCCVNFQDPEIACCRHDGRICECYPEWNMYPH